MSKSTATATHRKAARKPDKPRVDFPLFAHASGKWAKTIKGKTHYFGRWEDPDAAEQEYLAVAEDLHAGRDSAARERRNGGLTVSDACNAFLTDRRMKLNAGNLSPRTFVDYDRTCSLLVETFGRNRGVGDLGPADFQKLYAKFAQRFSPSSIGGQITQTRMVFRFAEESDLIDKRVKFGPTFKAPSKADLRKAKAKAKHKNGTRAFEAAQIRKMLDAASVQLKAMILLGINCGFGNTDCSSLPVSALDLDRGWLDYPRPKTGAERRIPLWPETVEALKAVIAQRKEPHDPDDANCVFLTKYRQRWVRYELVEETHFGKVKVKPKQDDAIAKATGTLLRELKLKRPALSFYSLRHTLETVGGGAKDQVALDAIMGHIDSSMAGNYRHHIEDERLKAVVDHVHDWLYADAFQSSEDVATNS